VKVPYCQHSSPQYRGRFFGKKKPQNDSLKRKKRGQRELRHFAVTKRLVALPERLMLGC